MNNIGWYTSKGQLISEWNFGVFKSPKKRTSFWQISALASKMGQIKNTKAVYYIR